MDDIFKDLEDRCESLFDKTADSNDYWERDNYHEE
jgi:hypothetical protein